MSICCLHALWTRTMSEIACFMREQDLFRHVHKVIGESQEFHGGRRYIFWIYSAVVAIFEFFK